MAAHAQVWAVAHVKEAAWRAYTTRLDAGADLNACDDEGGTLLHLAAELGDSDLVTALLLAGANPNVQARHGLTPLDLAANEATRNVLMPYVVQQARLPARAHVAGIG